MKKLLALLVVAVMGITAANADNGLNTNAGSLFAKNDLLGSFTLGSVMVLVKDLLSTIV